MCAPRKTDTLWFFFPPELKPVRFKVIYSRFGTNRVSVDLIYPLEKLPVLSDNSTGLLKKALGEAIQAALPDIKIAVWGPGRIDLEYLAKEKED